LTAACLVVLIGLLWRADVARLRGELDNGRSATDRSQPALDPGESAAVPPPSLLRSVKARARTRDYRPPPTESAAVAAFVNRDAKSRMTGDISSRIPRVDNETDVQALVTVLRDTEDKDAIRHEAANILRRSGYRHLTEDVIAILDDPAEAERFRAFCVQHLWLSLAGADAAERETIAARLRRALGDPDVGVRREALLALVRAGDDAGKTAAVEWLTQDGAGPVRDVAIRCVQDLGLREHTPAIRRYLGDADEVVRIAAIVTLSEWGDAESRPAFEAAAASPSVRLQRAGRLALRRLDEAAGRGAE
jgi:hypothetical protein